MTLKSLPFSQFVVSIENEDLTFLSQELHKKREMAPDFFEFPPIVIQINCKGAGIDFEKIKQRVMEENFILAGVSGELSDDQKTALHSLQIAVLKTSSDEVVTDINSFDALLGDQDLSIPLQSPDLEILYQDEHFVAVNKTAGLLVHRSWLDSHATEFALQKVRDQVGQYVYPIHRLDRPTSGVLLFALNKEAAKAVSLQFEEHQISKHYLAVVRGHLESGEIDYPLKEILDKITDKKAQQDKPAQSAFTSYVQCDKTETPYPVRPYPSSRYSLISLFPKTGRKHQLRRHLAHLRHPIVGDTTHGDGKHNKMFRENFDSHRLLLHAFQLSFFHPVLNKTINIVAPIDTEFLTLLSTLNLELNHAL